MGLTALPCYPEIHGWGSHVKHLSSFSCGHQTFPGYLQCLSAFVSPKINKYAAIGSSCLPLLSLFFSPTFSCRSYSPNKSSPINLNEQLDLSSLDVIQQLNWALGCHLLGIESPQKLTPPANHHVLALGSLLAGTIDAKQGIFPKIEMSFFFFSFPHRCPDCHSAKFCFSPAETLSGGEVFPWVLPPEDRDICVPAAVSWVWHWTSKVLSCEFTQEQIILPPAILLLGGKRWKASF